MAGFPFVKPKKVRMDPRDARPLLLTNSPPSFFPSAMVDRDRQRERSRCFFFFLTWTINHTLSIFSMSLLLTSEKEDLAIVVF